MNNPASIAARIAPVSSLRSRRREFSRSGTQIGGGRRRSGAVDAFVASILARHRGSRRGWRPLERNFRLPVRPQPIILRPSHWHEHRLALRVGMLLQRQLRERPAPRPLAAGRVVFVAARPMPLTAAFRPAVTERIFQRERRIERTRSIASRVERLVIKSAAARQPAVADPATYARRPPPLPMVARRPPEPRAEPTPSRQSPPRQAIDEWAMAPARLRPAAATTALALDPGELGRLTDHVINAIDRRFTAHRERHGRV